MVNSGSDQRKTRVAVIFGGRSDEHDVSLRSAQTVMGALDPDRYEIVPVGITREGTWLPGETAMSQLVDRSPMFHLTAGEESAVPTSARDIQVVTGSEALMPTDVAAAIDVFFPVLHGPMGEDGSIQGLFELAGVPFVGSGVLGSAVGMDKAMTKIALASAGVPQIPWKLIQRRSWQDDPEGVEAMIMQELPFPMFIKPANLGSSVGISKADTPEELHEAIREAAHFDRRIIVEKGISGRELEMAVLGNDNPIVSGIGEIKPNAAFYDYASKYLDDSAELIIPAEIDPEIQRQMGEYAVLSFLTLDLAGLARVDFFVEHDTNEIYVNEVNTMPGFTSISMYPSLWKEAGLEIEELVDRLVELAIERHDDKHGR